MSGNLTRGDRAIVYLGNLNMGAAEELLAALRDQGIEVVAKLKAGREPAGPPLIVAVIQDPDEAPALEPYDADEAVWRGDCQRLDPHYPHTWSQPSGARVYCKGVPR